MSSSASATGAVVWKHIGFHGLAVGTFLCQPDGTIIWKSSSNSNNNNDVATSTTRKISATKIKHAKWTVFGKTGSIRLILKDDAKQQASSSEWRLDGFPVADYEKLTNIFKQDTFGNIEIKVHNMCSTGVQYGITRIQNKNMVLRQCELMDAEEEGQEFEVSENHEIFSLDLQEVSQCVLPGNNRNEMELQFPETDTMEAGTDQLVAIRMYIPPDPEADPADKEAATAAEELQQVIMNLANIRKTTGDVLVQFEGAAFLTPRGRYGIELYDNFLRMRGQKYDYKIRYNDINRLFLLPKPDEVTMAFVIALDKPIRQGQQRYQYLVMQASKDQDEVNVNLDEDALEKEYDGELQPVMRGSLSNLIAKTFKVIARKKVFIPGKFANANQQACLSCSVRANEGLLYPLEKQFVFIHKPPIIIRFNEIESVEFQRYAGGQGSTRNFDLQVNLKEVGAGVKDYTFSGIDRSDYASLYSFLSGKKIAIQNLQGIGGLDTAVVSSTPVYNEDEIFGGGGGGDDEDESDDESYGKADAAKDEAPMSDEDSEEIDDDEMGSEVDEGLDSDLEEARGKKKPASSSKKNKKKRDAEDSDDDDDDDSDDEEDSKPKKKKSKKSKDPNAPKRALTAYFFFMNKNRDRIKEENPDAAFSDIGKILGKEWKSLSADAKAKYEAMAKEDKERYKQEMKDYTPPSSSKKGAASSKKKAKKDPNAPKKAMGAFMCFSTTMRPKIKAENPALTFGDLGKKIGELYRGLSAEEKKEYQEMADKDKKRYEKEMAAYSSKQKADDDGVDDDDEDLDDDDSSNDDDDDDDDDDSDDE